MSDDPVQRRLERKRKLMSPPKAMVDSLDRNIHLPLFCPECGEQFSATASLLKAHKAIPCRACGVAIDLTEPERRAFLDEYVKNAASVFPKPPLR